MKKPVKNENLEKLVRVRLAPSEHKKLKEKASERLLPISTYLRLIATGRI